VFLYNLDSQDLVAAVERHSIRAQRIGFSMVKTEAPVYFDLATSTIHFNIHFNSETMARKRSITKRLPIDLNVDGKHNRYNAMASATIGSLLDIRKERVRESLSEFRNADHRLENVTTVNGRKFVNDSKATNINASWFALESMNSKVVWIVGGVDKGNDYGMVLELVKKKCHTVVMLGRDEESVERIRSAFEGHVEQLYHATSMEQAVHKSYQFASEGDTVLLSPACASFDMFEDYEDRGNRFKRVIRTLS
ncbi:MAG: glutamate ligase domain-containing protein, partial [Bacteroidota bacterium]